MTRAHLGRTILGLAFILAGVLHFILPSYYQVIVPPYLPAPAALVAISGLAEIAGGIGLLLPRVRQMAGIGLIVLLVVVFPANVEMLQQARRQGPGGIVEAILWLRLPFQAVLIWWVWRLSRMKPQVYSSAERGESYASL